IRRAAITPQGNRYVLTRSKPDGRSRFTDAKLGMIYEACKFLSNFFAIKITHPYIAADYT
ncbi:hypothetical protein, partial [Paramuribaculum intestinale]|uniref:hypothetical protein n=1 Tax=Paramuribaculum intestinale TaxID=2094151 RepID=UPI00272B3BD9